jgi:hypothetical protein
MLHDERVSLAAALFAVVASVAADTAADAAADTAADRFPAPAGFVRVDVQPGSFGAFLRALPLRPAGTPVRTHDGRVVAAPWAQAVVALDTGPHDLQQCADSAIRLYAEHRRAQGTTADLVFHATSGDPLPWARYAAGERPLVKDNRVRWRAPAGPTTPSSPASPSSPTFRAWLDFVFTYAGSSSLRLDTKAATGPVMPGDLYVLPGFPGHVLVVVDVARDPRGAERLLLGEGYMPAQDFHLLGWIAPAADGAVVVDSWPSPFAASMRRRFAAP